MTWRELPSKLRVYIVVLSVLSVPILLSAVWDLHYHPRTSDNGWIVLIVLTVLTIPFYQLLPSVSTTVGIGDAYVMAIAMIYGTSECLIATLCHALVGSLFPKRPKIYAHRVIFNVASTLCCAWIYTNIYILLNPSLNRTGTQILLPIVALTTTFFLLNSLSTATAIALASGQNILRFWTQNYLSLGVEFSVSAVSAAVIVRLYSGDSPWVPLAVAPLIGVVWGWNKLNKAKAMEAEAHLKEQEALYLRTVESLALAVDAKDQTTYGHIRRVRAYALGLAKLAGIKDPNDLMAIETGSLLHDIGKLAIDDYILNKPGRLSKQEFEKMKMHAAAGDEILQQIRFPFPVAQYVRCHHERWDGQGYPDGLKGTDIPLGARILAIADAFDAIRSTRPYKLSFGIQDSLELLKSQAGTVYDPELIAIFVEHIAELESSAEEAARNMPELSFRKYFEKVDQAISSADQALSEYVPSVPSSSDLVYLFEFLQSVGRHLELLDVLNILGRRLQRILQFDTCAFFLDSGNNTVTAVYVLGDCASSLQDRHIELGKGISGWVAAYKRSIVNTSPALEFQEIPGHFAFADILCVPIVTDGICLGTLSLYSKIAHCYSQSDLLLMQAIAEHAAPVISDRMQPEAPQYEDPITRDRTVAFLYPAAAQLITLARKNNAPLSLLCLDVSNYQQLMTFYGPETANAAAKSISEIVKTELRETDVLVRYGQQAFIALLPGVRPEQAHRYAQRLQTQIRNTSVPNLLGHPVQSNCQFAISSFPQDGDNLLALIRSVRKSLSEHAVLANTPEEELSRHVLEFAPRQKN